MTVDDKTDHSTNAFFTPYQSLSHFALTWQFLLIFAANSHLISTMQFLTRCFEGMPKTHVCWVFVEQEPSPCGINYFFSRNRLCRNHYVWEHAPTKVFGFWNGFISLYDEHEGLNPLKLGNKITFQTNHKNWLTSVNRKLNWPRLVSSTYR